MNGPPFSPQIQMVKRPPPYQILKVLEDGGDNIPFTLWSGGRDGVTPTLSTSYSVRGGHSIILATDASLDPSDISDFANDKDRGDLSAYAHEWVYGWFYFPALALAHLNTYVQLLMGLYDYSKYIYTNFNPASLVVGWNILKMDLDNPTVNSGAFGFTSTSKLRLEYDALAGNTADFEIYLGYLAFVRPLT